MQYLAIYLAAINLTGLFIMGIDKRKAKRQSWRISEKTLFIVALVGGAIGMKIGMELFRHKTHHKQFVYGIPAIIVLQLAVAAFFVYRLYF
jgi:uncharacterized membrane protein YsdA (DUF1294 family)